MPPRYTDDFKMEAAKQVFVNGHDVKDVASRLGVHQDSLKTWVRIYKYPKVIRLQYPVQRIYDLNINSKPRIKICQEVERLPFINLNLNKQL